MKTKKIFLLTLKFKTLLFNTNKTILLFSECHNLHFLNHNSLQFQVKPVKITTKLSKNKLQYLEYYSQFNEMRFMENMAGLKSKYEKQALLENFLNMFEDMISCLMAIQNTLLLINFDNPDFSQVYSVPPNIMVDILFKDIKTLEGLHLEMQYASSLRFLETVLEALEFNSQLYYKIHQLDVKQWSQKCNNYLNSFTTAQQQINNSQRSCCCFK